MNTESLNNSYRREIMATLQSHYSHFIGNVRLKISTGMSFRVHFVWWWPVLSLPSPAEGSVSDSTAQPSSAPGSINNSTWASIPLSSFLFVFPTFLFSPLLFSLSTLLLAPNPSNRKDNYKHPHQYSALLFFLNVNHFPAESSFCGCQLQEDVGCSMDIQVSMLGLNISCIFKSRVALVWPLQWWCRMLGRWGEGLYMLYDLCHDRFFIPVLCLFYLH